MNPTVYIASHCEWSDYYLIEDILAAATLEELIEAVKKDSQKLYDSAPLKVEVTDKYITLTYGETCEGEYEEEEDDYIYYKLN